MDKKKLILALKLTLTYNYLSFGQVDSVEFKVRNQVRRNKLFSYLKGLNNGCI